MTCFSYVGCLYELPGLLWWTHRVNEAPRDVPGQPCGYVLHVIMKWQSQVATLAAAISAQPPKPPPHPQPPPPSHQPHPHPPVRYLCMNLISQSRRQNRTCDNISCITQARQQGRTCHLASIAITIYQARRQGRTDNILLKGFRFMWVCSRWNQVMQWVFGCCHADRWWFVCNIAIS